MNMRSTKRRNGARPFLSTLARDVRGNTLMLVAAALIPLMAMIGSGVDMARGYMAQDRLQQACDAGVLAARRQLSGAALTDAVKNEATTYFNFNFPQATYGVAAFTPVVTVPKAGTVTMTAKTTLPTAIMGIVGIKSMKLAAACSATQDFVSTDIVLVMDMSGSMNCPTSRPDEACGNVEQSNSKMSALRSAALSLYDTLESAQNQLHDNSLRLRYGFVPYNGTVNVGRAVYAKNPDYLRRQLYPYQTRQWTQVTRQAADAGMSRSECNRVNGDYVYYYGRYYCVYNYTSSEWVYGQYNVDVSRYITGAATSIPAQRNGSTAKWAGCIEERKTNNTTITGGSSPTTAPSDALDLDINRLPDSDDSRWGPWWPEVEFDPSAGGASAQPGNCASEASRLTEYYKNRSAFAQYLNNLTPQGATYHDVGMIWGARFLSSKGIFKSSTSETNDQFTPDNPEKIRGFSVRKYMIFMTDGDMSTYPTIYSTYGLESLDKRVLGSAPVDAKGTNLTNRHLQRFRMACNAAKGQNIDIWVIAFSTTLTQDMIDCASTPSQAAGINTSADLIAKFKEIGSKIGSLRLSR
ncbi:TadE/TadG family type IV pilus assembly protein [Sphingomonas sp. ac-8]|uniref:TadE/TadG family type IV pilus assembly protein n=1 Tax=Sphingomonas sp. ac-8 TaxID=3242977 RepID=UPI003A80BD1F